MGTPLDAIVWLHRRLLPRNPDIGWTPYLWLFYLTAFYFQYVRGPAPVIEIVLAVLSGAVFLVLYFNGHWHHGRRVLFNAYGIFALGAIWMPFNVGAVTLFVYAGSFLGAVGPPRLGARHLVLIEAVFLLEWWLLDLPWFVLVGGGVLTALIAAVNIYYADLTRKSAELKLTQEEVRQLAAMAERERIARDLHDLLGHTLSVITIKSELARKLIERGDSRAAAEVEAVEQISRDALRQVREAVTGFRRTGLIGELANARLACEAMGIALESDLGGVELDAATEAVLAMVVREAVTNVVRHSGADRCTVRVQQQRDRVRLEVHDNGRGADPTAARAGSGLFGMRQRLEAAGGGLELTGPDGTTLIAWVPLDPEAARDPAAREATA